MEKPNAVPGEEAVLLLAAIVSEVHDIDQLGPATDHRFAYIEERLNALADLLRDARKRTAMEECPICHMTSLCPHQRPEKAPAPDLVGELVDAATVAADGLEADAVEIRGSWADFDGRDNLRNVRAWLAPLRAILARAKEGR